MAKSSRYHSEPRTEALGDAVDNAFGEVEQLASEMGEWRDGLEEKFSSTEKYQRVSDAADALESHQEPPNVDEALRGIEVQFSETVKRKSRSGPSRDVRLGNAVSRLNACVDALQGRLDEHEEAADGDPGKLPDDAVNTLEELRDALQEAVDELDGGVEFPGMFG